MKSFLTIFAAVAWLSLASPSQGAFYTNIIQAYSFHPPTRTIVAGDTVVWVNLDAAGHTVTGDMAEEPICGSGILTQSSSCMRRFDTVGSFTYHCEPHESMVGTIVVEPPGNLSPVVFISSPMNGASFTGPTNVLIRATADDPDGVVGMVTFFDGTKLLGSDTSAPFQVNPNLGPGPHTLTAVASDDSGEQTRSFPVTITIASPLRFLDVSVGANLVLTYTPTNYANVHPECKTDLSGTNWLAMTVRSNRMANGALEIFCSRPAGNSVFIRLKSP